MVELENNVLQMLSDNIKFWKRFFDDPAILVKNDNTGYISKKLNSFYETKITYFRSRE